VELSTEVKVDKAALVTVDEMAAAGPELPDDLDSNEAEVAVQTTPSTVSANEADHRRRLVM
jgi:hypothetical protein